MDGSFFSKFWLRISADAPVIACRATQRAPAGVPTTARAWAELMGRLEYKHYVAQGGDWGSVVADVMARGASILHHRTPTVRCRKNDTIAPVHCVATRELCEAPGMLALGFGCDTIAVEAMQVLGNVVDSLRQIITMGDKDRRRSLTASTRAARSFTG